ncbi:hypothetical protein [Pararhodobacter aggregans]|uniref:hypothetical protein n=1 Tax=Pararhodobacter aggregans TaxID=404875 RepID=UPI000D4026E7|nr:hypothetical protein [Pararhodobacter aggregans]PTX00297.1 hypothetical protein C8N33_1103 [Pararhodobacter aggregans]
MSETSVQVESAVRFAEKEWEKTREQIHLILSFIWRFEGATLVGYGAFFIWIISQARDPEPIVNPLWYVGAGIVFQLVLILRLKVEYAILMCLSVYSKILEEVIITSGNVLYFDAKGIPHCEKPPEYVDLIERVSRLPLLGPSLGRFLLYTRKDGRLARSNTNSHSSRNNDGSQHTQSGVHVDDFDISRSVELASNRSFQSSSDHRTEQEKSNSNLVALGWERFLWNAKPDQFSFRVMASRYTNTALGLFLIFCAQLFLGLMIFFSTPEHSNHLADAPAAFRLIEAFIDSLASVLDPLMLVHH